jgi:hypothetical protein
VEDICRKSNPGVRCRSNSMRGNGEGGPTYSC